MATVQLSVGVSRPVSHHATTIKPRMVVGYAPTRALAPLYAGSRRKMPLGKVQAMSEATGSTGLQPELKAAIESFIQENKVVLFMKGTRDMPMCGFSNTTVQILNSMSVPYVTVNILEDDLLRSGMKEFSQWPTFPQVYIGGEFFGGCDIMIASYQSGELAETLEAALNS